jgi:hypothetical protein
VDFLYTSYPISGSPENVIAANTGSIFYSRGQVKRLNYSGSEGYWIDVCFKPIRTPSIYEVSQSLDWNPYTYVKTGSNNEADGWRFLVAGDLFVNYPTSSL